jgi:hypothetical protein
MLGERPYGTATGGATEVFVQDFKVLDARYEDVTACLLADAKAIFAEALGSSRAEGERITSRVGPRGWPPALGKTVEISLESARQHFDGAVLSFSWQAHGGTSLFPRLDADLEVAPFGPGHSALTLRGTYDPPGGVLGKLADELVLHRVACATLRAFLEALCARLSRSVAELSNSQVPAGQRRAAVAAGLLGRHDAQRWPQRYPLG